MWTVLTRVIAAVACLWAAGALAACRLDRGTCTARRFLALGFGLWGGFFVYSAITRPLETLHTALLTGSITRGLAVWLAVGVVVLVRQRERVLRKWQGHGD